MTTERHSPFAFSPINGMLIELENHELKAEIRSIRSELGIHRELACSCCEADYLRSFEGIWICQRCDCCGRMVVLKHSTFLDPQTFYMDPLRKWAPIRRQTMWDVFVEAAKR